MVVVALVMVFTIFVVAVVVGEEQREKSNVKRDSKGRRLRELETGSMGRAM